MKAEPVKAWQPLTFGGVARYAHDWVGRLVVTCLVISLCTAAAVLWTVRRAWFPVIADAIEKLPTSAEIRAGRLTAPEPLRLAENQFLALRLDPRALADMAATSDVQVTLASSGVRVRSLFGSSTIPYQPQWTVNLNPADLEPKWGAWRPMALVYLGFGTIFFLFASWIGVGIAYTPIAFLLGLVLKRKLSLWGSWKLAVAALMPGAIFQTAAIAFYGLGNLRVPEMIGAFAFHFVIGWAFLIGGTVAVPKRQDNPFAKDRTESGDNSDEDPSDGKLPESDEAAEAGSDAGQGEGGD